MAAYWLCSAPSSARSAPIGDWAHLRPHDFPGTEGTLAGVPGDGGHTMPDLANTSGHDNSLIERKISVRPAGVDHRFRPNVTRSAIIPVSTGDIPVGRQRLSDKMG